MMEYASRMEGITGSAIRDLFKLAAKPDIISFGGGNPSPDTFDHVTLAGLSQELLLNQGKTVLQYGMTEGWAPLKETLIARLAKTGVRVSMDEMVITTGSMQGIEFAAKVLVNPSDAVLVEAPAFLGALQTFKTYQANIIPVEMDDDGLCPDDLERKAAQYRPKVLYTVPTFQNPSGRTLSPARREKVAELASRYRFVVFEDDPYCELRFSGEPLPSIKSFDRTGNVLLLHSFSKTVSPGLRVGMAAGDAALIRKMVIVKQSGDTHTANLSQALVNAYLQSGKYETHIRETCALYAEKLGVMQGAIAKSFPAEARCVLPQGGLFLWVELPERLDATQLFKEAVERKVAFIPGEYFYAQNAKKNTLRLNFSQADAASIEKGIATLGELLREACRA